MNLKSAILGTQHTGDDARDILRQAGIRGFQRLAGYIAPVMPVLDDYEIAPVHENYLALVDPMIQELADNKNLVNCNPRAPYLLLAWLVVGSDNPYRSCQYASDTRIHNQVAIYHIRIALGDIIKGQVSSVSSIVNFTAAAWADKTASWVDRTNARAAAKATIWTAIKNQAALFGQIDDSRALCIARQLTLDILELKDNYPSG
jgi:hypothetical protein